MQTKMSSTSRNVKKLSFGVEKILMMEATSNDSEKPMISSYPFYSAFYTNPGSYRTRDFEQSSTNFPYFQPYDPGTLTPFVYHYGNKYGSTGNLVRPTPIHTASKETVSAPAITTTNRSENVGGRRRSWSRAVFSALQRKGLEKRFLVQKYIAKPDRRALAATLGLTDAQVKVWFQNRRMKWRHSTRNEKSAESHATQFKESASSIQNLQNHSETKSSDNEDIDVESDV